MRDAFRAHCVRRTLPGAPRAGSACRVLHAAVWACDRVCSDALHAFVGSTALDSIEGHLKRRRTRLAASTGDPAAPTAEPTRASATGQGRPLATHVYTCRCCAAPCVPRAAWSPARPEHVRPTALSCRVRVCHLACCSEYRKQGRSRCGTRMRPRQRAKRGLERREVATGVTGPARRAARCLSAPQECCAHGSLTHRCSPWHMGLDQVGGGL